MGRLRPGGLPVTEVDPLAGYTVGVTAARRAGKRVVVQLHGEPLPDFVTALRDAGADVTEVSVYRWTAPADTNPLDRLLDAIVGRQVDALAFTSAPAVASTLARAKATGRRDAV